MNGYLVNMKYYFYIPHDDTEIIVMLHEDFHIIADRSIVVDYWNNPKALFWQSKKQCISVEWIPWHYQLIYHLMEIYGWDKYLTIIKRN